jgi:hypothetical protein
MVHTDFKRMIPASSFLPEASSFESGIKLSLGNIVVTPGALSTISPDEIRIALSRHSRGDWGDLDIEDAQMNGSP